MRRRLVAPLLVLVALTSSAGAATDPVQQRAQEVRYAVPAAFAYYADHGSYVGMTLAKLRRYDRGIKNVAVRRATKTRFCVLSTKRPFVHYDGPAGPVRRGGCGVRGAEVPRPGDKPAPTATTPEQHVRYAVPAIEAYAADNGGYTGMTPEKLQRWDATISDIRVVWATHDSYCVESGTDAATYHKAGPGQSVAPGPCPAPPG